MPASSWHGIRNPQRTQPQGDHMEERNRELVGHYPRHDHELSSVGFTIANGGITAG
jgi:hypothetical protein